MNEKFTTNWWLQAEYPLSGEKDQLQRTLIVRSDDDGRKRYSFLQTISLTPDELFCFYFSGEAHKNGSSPVYDFKDLDAHMREEVDVHPLIGWFMVQFLNWRINRNTMLE